MHDIWFTSDTHFFHKNIVTYSTRPFVDEEEMNEAMITYWNELVRPGDHVYHLGDFAMARGNTDKVNKILSRLNGCKTLIKGNHDSKETYHNKSWNHVCDYHELKIDFGDIHKQRIVLFHYPIVSWNGLAKGSWMLHGHCVDEETEILTNNGWKNSNQIFVGEAIPTYRHDINGLEQDQINTIIKYDYTGNMYNFSGKSIDMKVTEDHTIPHFSRDGLSMYKSSAEELFKKSRVSFLRCSSKKDQQGISLSDNMIRLYVLISADGSIKKETKLVRIRVCKDRKKKYITSVLSSLNIPYKRLDNENGENNFSSFNFYLPQELEGLNIKGVDQELDLLNQKQLYILLEAYSNSDGCINGNGFIVYSSKEEEIDQLQMIAVQNGFGATKYGRTDHGFSTNTSYQLSVYPADTMLVSNLQERVEIEHVINEPVWCIKTNNKNFIMRRKGKVHLTGNCHGNLPQASGKIIDVGVDRHSYRPVHIKEIKNWMDKREVRLTGDHHGKERS